MDLMSFFIQRNTNRKIKFKKLGKKIRPSSKRLKVRSCII